MNHHKSNTFNVLQETDNETSNTDRKALKKLREIEKLKLKHAETLTLEEIEKIAQEKYWKAFLKYQTHNIPSNELNITHSCFEINNLSNQHIECPICYDKIKRTQLITTNCNHIYCCNCIKNVISHTTHIISCSMCRANITKYNYNDFEIMVEITNLLEKQFQYNWYSYEDLDYLELD